MAFKETWQTKVVKKGFEVSIHTPTATAARIKADFAKVPDTAKLSDVDEDGDEIVYKFVQEIPE